MPQTANVNRQILLASRPVGAPTAANFHMVESPVPTPGPGQMLLRNVSMVEAVLAAMPARFGATTPLEQAIAAAALRADGYAATSLPPHFSGHCWFGRSGLSLCELTT